MAKIVKQQVIGDQLCNVWLLQNYGGFLGLAACVQSVPAVCILPCAAGLFQLVATCRCCWPSRRAHFSSSSSGSMCVVWRGDRLLV